MLCLLCLLCNIRVAWWAVVGLGGLALAGLWWLNRCFGRGCGNKRGLGWPTLGCLGLGLCVWWG